MQLKHKDNEDMHIDDATRNLHALEPGFNVLIGPCTPKLSLLEADLGFAYKNQKTPNMSITRKTDTKDCSAAQLTIL